MSRYTCGSRDETLLIESLANAFVQLQWGVNECCYVNRCLPTSCEKSCRYETAGEWLVALGLAFQGF